MDWYKLKDIIDKHKKPIFLWLFGEKSEILEAEKIFQEIQIPLFHSEREIVSTFKKIVEFQNSRYSSK